MGSTILRGRLAALEKAGHPQDAASIVTWQQEREWGGWVGNMAVLKKTMSLYRHPPTPMLNAHCCLPHCRQVSQPAFRAVSQRRKKTISFFPHI